MATHDVSKELKVAMQCVGKRHIEPGNLALVQAQLQMVVALGSALPPHGAQFLTRKVKKRADLGGKTNKPVGPLLELCQSPLPLLPSPTVSWKSILTSGKGCGIPAPSWTIASRGMWVHEKSPWKDSTSPVHECFSRFYYF